MKNILILLFLALLLQGCEKNSIPVSIQTPDGLVQWNILKVEGPVNASLNQTITLEVTYPTSSGCDFVSEFVTADQNKYVYVKAFGNTLKDAPCTLAAIPQKTDFKYTLTKSGDIIFKFINKDNSSIDHKVQVR